MSMLSIIFGSLGIAAIALGGLISAFWARKPSRLAMWLSAYLVIVAGLIQLGLAVGWQRLGAHEPQVAGLAFATYNLGNIGVVLGRSYTGRFRHSYSLVRVGGLLLAASMILLLLTLRGVAFSWTAVWFCALIAVIFVSMPIGILLSRRRHHARAVAH